MCLLSYRLFSEGFKYLPTAAYAARTWFLYTQLYQADYKGSTREQDAN